MNDESAARRLIRTGSASPCFLLLCSSHSWASLLGSSSWCKVPSTRRRLPSTRDHTHARANKKPASMARNSAWPNRDRWQRRFIMPWMLHFYLSAPLRLRARVFLSALSSSSVVGYPDDCATISGVVNHLGNTRFQLRIDPFGEV